jgi:hypothetical protein
LEELSVAGPLVNTGASMRQISRNVYVQAQCRKVVDNRRRLMSLLETFELSVTVDGR